MHKFPIHPKQLRTIARWALVVFVMAWVNLVIQAPLHAAMKHNNDLPCGCDVSLCDTVLSMEERSDDGLISILPVMADFQVAFVSLVPGEFKQALVQHQFDHAALLYAQYSPPPLLLNTILII